MASTNDPRLSSDEMIGEYADTLLLGQGVDVWRDATYRNMGGEMEAYKEIIIDPSPGIGLTDQLMAAIRGRANNFACGSYFFAGDGTRAILAIPKEDYEANVRPQILKRSGVSPMQCNLQRTEVAPVVVIRDALQSIFFESGEKVWKFYKSDAVGTQYRRIVPLRQLGDHARKHWSLIEYEAHHIMKDLGVSGLRMNQTDAGSVKFTLPAEQFELLRSKFEQFSGRHALIGEVSHMDRYRERRELAANKGR